MKRSNLRIIFYTVAIMLFTSLTLVALYPVESSVQMSCSSEIKCNYLFAGDITVDGIRYSANDGICAKHFNREKFNMALITKVTTFGIKYHGAHILPSN